MNKYKLNSGDIIKIGRISLRIRDIHFAPNNNSNNVNKNDILSNSDNNDFNNKDLNTLRTEANANGNVGSRNYLSKKVNFLVHQNLKELNIFH